MKSRELKTYNLPSDQTIRAEISAKPTLLFIMIITLGMFSLFLNISFVFCFLIIAVGTMCLLFLPRVTIMRFYDDSFVMYNRADKTKCMLIYYSEVKSWRYNWSAKKDILDVELEDGSVEKLEGFSKPIFEAYMNRYLKDKRRKNK